MKLKDTAKMQSMKKGIDDIEKMTFKMKTKINKRKPKLRQFTR